MHANNRLDTIPWQHATTIWCNIPQARALLFPFKLWKVQYLNECRTSQRNLIRNSMTLESQSTLLKIIASNSATATPSSTSITRVINLPLLSKADLSSEFCIHDSQQDFWLTKCFWSKYCSAATWNKTLIPIRPSSFPEGVFWLLLNIVSSHFQSSSFTIPNIQIIFCQVAIRRPKCSHPVTCTPHVRTSMPIR